MKNLAGTRWKVVIRIITRKISDPNVEEDKGSCSSTNHFWNKIWSCNIPPKIKIFVWKAAQDILAMEFNLANHHIPCDPRCILCGYFKVDTTHALFYCQVVKKTWSTSKWRQTIHDMRGLTALDIFNHTFTSLSQVELKDFCTKAWGVWKDRCTLSHKDQPKLLTIPRNP